MKIYWNGMRIDNVEAYQPKVMCIGEYLINNLQQGLTEIIKQMIIEYANQKHVNIVTNNLSINLRVYSICSTYHICRLKINFLEENNTIEIIFDMETKF